MDEQHRTYSATNLNLTSHGLQPAMRYLIATALNGSTRTYGELKRHLENEASFSTIFATRIGFLAGELMNAIQHVDPDAPLLNVIVVNQQDGQPSKGAGPFMATRFNNPMLAEEGCKQRHPEVWKSYFDRAAGEVYAYRAAEWSRLYERVFGARLAAEEIEEDRTTSDEGEEADFGTGAGKYGAGGESEFHRALRLWVTANPSEVHLAYADARAETEFNLDSGDRVDAVYHLLDRSVVLEVKSRISDAVDLRRGVFQCIKYRAVKRAMDVRADAPVEAILVTESEIPGDIAALLRRHEIKHYRAPMLRARGGAE